MPNDERYPNTVDQFHPAKFFGPCWAEGAVGAVSLDRLLTDQDDEQSVAETFSATSPPISEGDRPRDEDGPPFAQVISGHSWSPPSTASDCPVTYFARSDSR